MTDWTKDQRDLRDSFRHLYETLSADYVVYDRAGEFPWEPWKLVCDSGLLRLPFEKRWGGLGQSLLTTMYVLEGLGYGCRNGGLNFSVCTHLVSTGVPLQRFGSNELKERFLRRICDGATIGAHAITEPESGSDALNMTTAARADGDEYVLDGRKAFVSNGPVADLFTVYARTDPDAGFWGVTAFLVERKTPGLTVGPPIEKMGLRGSPLGALFFEGCRVPAGNVVGRPGAGFLILDHVMKWEILCSFIVNVGEMQNRLERCVDYAKNRRQFGKPIGAFQSVANKVVDMRIAVDTARHWLYASAERFARGENVTADIAIAKLLASEGNLASALSAVQVFGGNGYLTEYGLEQELRNAVGGTLYSGTSEIQRNKVAAMMGLQ